MPRRDLSDWDRINREYYNEGYRDGLRDAQRDIGKDFGRPKPKTKRKPSKYNLFVKAKSKGQKFKYKSGPDKGKLNMRKIGIAWRKTRR